MLVKPNLLGLIKVLLLAVVALAESSSGAPLLTCIVMLVVAEQQPVWFQLIVMVLVSIGIASLYAVPVTVVAVVYSVGLFFLDRGASVAHQRELRLATAGIVGSVGIAVEAGTVWSPWLVAYYLCVVVLGAGLAYRSSKHRVRHQLRLKGV